LDNASQLQIKQWKKKRWYVWIPLALAFLTSYFHRTSMGVVSDSLMRDFSITSAADLGIMSSIYFYTYAAMQMPTGILADYFGPRRVISSALLIAGAGAMLMGWAESLVMLYIGRFLASLGVSLIYVNIVKIHAEWFRLREFGTMTGLIALAGSIGFFISATPLAIVVESFGWRSAFYSIAVYSIVFALLCWLFVKDSPVEVGLPSIAELEGRKDKSDNGKPCIKEGIKAVVLNPYTWWPFLACACVYGVYMAFMGIWGVPYFMQVYGMTRVAAANYMLAVAVGTMIGGPIVGILSDRIKLRRAPFVWFTVFFLAIWLVLTVWQEGKPPVWSLYPLCFSIGLGMSGINLAVACAKEVNSPLVTGLAAGVANSSGFIGAAVMQPAFGWILDRNWQGIMEQGVRIYPQSAYQSAFWLCGIILFVGLVCTLLIKETGCTNSWEKK
jgi:sugar phosphate permease